MPIDTYIKTIWDRFEVWIDGIRDGKVVAGVWLKLAIERFREDLAREDLDMRVNEVERVFKFFYYLSIRKGDHWERFMPIPWQIFVVVNLYGFYYKKSGRRRFRYNYTLVSRKTGKTTFSAILQLFGLVGDKHLSPQSILCANTQTQAGLALKAAKEIVQNSKSLSKRLKTGKKSYDIYFRDPDKFGICRTISSNLDSMDGLENSTTLVDELHTMENWDIINILKSGTVSIENALTHYITSAGYSTTSVAYQLFEQGQRVLKREMENDIFFYLMFTLDFEDDPNDLSVWPKANPSLGETIKLDILEGEFTQAKTVKSNLKEFYTKNLNIFTEAGDDEFVEPEYLKKAIEEKVDWSEFEGMECTAGLDLSKTKDLTSFSLVFRKDGQIYVKNISFFPEGAKSRIRESGTDLLPWIRDGLILRCPGGTINYDTVFDEIKRLSQKYIIRRVDYDKYAYNSVIPKIQDLGIPCYEFGQNAMKFNRPLKELQRLFYDENIKFGHNPFLRWQFANVGLYYDGNDNIKILKNTRGRHKSKDSVDAAVATSMALGGLLELEDAERN